MKCEVARQALAELTPARPILPAVKQHLADCPRCRTRFVQLAQTLISDAEDNLSCAECRARFPAYLEIVTEAAESLSQEMAEVATHLGYCAYCAEEFQALQETMVAIANGTLPHLTQKPTFDLSFLRQPKPQLPQLWLVDTATATRRLFTEIAIQIGKRAAAFGNLPPLLIPTPIAVGALRSEEREGQGQVLVLPDLEGDLSVELLVGPVVNARAPIAVRLRSATSGQPLANTRIMLYDSAHQLLSGSVTEQEGSVTFSDLELGRYILQVRNQGQRWELPVLLSQES